MTNRTGNQITLGERIYQIDPVQGKRFARLEGDAREIAVEGIIRHLKACLKLDVQPDYSAIREIIDDALTGKKIFADAAH